MATESQLTIDDLRELAKKVDAGQSVEVESDDDNEDVESSATHEEEQEPTQDEIEKAEQAKEKAAKSSDTTEDEDEDEDEDEEVVLTKEEKEKERYDRNWKKLEERKAELERKEKELADKERASSKTKDLKDERDEDGYSVKDYEFAVKKFKEEGNDELAVEADRKAKDLYFQGFQREWKANMNELIDQHPDLSDSRKPFTIACDAVLNQLPFLKTIPDGCRYAVRIAMGETGSSMVSELKAENTKLKKEVERLNKATRLSGSLPSKLPAGKTFDDMSDKDRLNHLRDLAEAADRGEL